MISVMKVTKCYDILLYTWFCFLKIPLEVALCKNYLISHYDILTMHYFIVIEIEKNFLWNIQSGPIWCDRFELLSIQWRYTSFSFSILEPCSRKRGLCSAEMIPFEISRRILLREMFMLGKTIKSVHWEQLTIAEERVNIYWGCH